MLRQIKNFDLKSASIIRETCDILFQEEINENLNETSAKANSTVKGAIRPIESSPANNKAALFTTEDQFMKAKNEIVRSYLDQLTRISNK